MARSLRIEYHGAFYHITARGNERKRIFFGKSDYDRFIAYVKEAREKYGFRFRCYVLMTNHYGLIKAAIFIHPFSASHSASAPRQANRQFRFRKEVNRALQSMRKAAISSAPESHRRVEEIYESAE